MNQISYYKKRYWSDPIFKARERKRGKIYGTSAQGRKMKRKNYDKQINTEKGYLKDKWNSMKTKSRGGGKKDRKKVSLTITREEFYELWEQHKKRYGGWFCAYTGQPMTRLRSMNRLKNFKSHISNTGKQSGRQVRTNLSVDRIDSGKGYTKDNIVFCTWDFNDRKGNISLEDIRCILNLKESIKNY